MKEKSKKNLIVLICTNNNGKIKEFKNKMLNHYFYTLKDENIFIDIDENGHSFQENSLIKLNTIIDSYPYLKEKYDLIIAEDSGLCVDALNGEPGIYSARYAGIHGNDDLNNEKLLFNLKTENNRKAHYEICISIYYDKSIYTFVDSMNGSISTHTKGINGFGYDPLFIPDGYSQTFGELDSQLKSVISHRSKAIEQMIGFVNNLSK